MTLPEEIQRIREWITKHGATGQKCDECGLTLVEGERGKVAVTRIIYGHVMYLICDRCGQTATPNIERDALRITGRLITESAAAIFMEPRRR